MSDTIYTHNVTVKMVLDTLPVNTTTVTANSNGLNYGIIDGFIARAAGQVNAALVRHGISPRGMDQDSSQVAQDAIVAYSAAYSLERLGSSSELVERRLREYEKLMTLLKKDPNSLGAAQDATRPQVLSNADLCHPVRFPKHKYR